MPKKLVKKKPAKRNINKASKTRTPPWRLLPLILILAGIMMLGIWSSHAIFRFRALSISDRILDTHTATTSASMLPVRILVGKDIDLPVVPAGKINGVWTISSTAANHVSNSASPGETGNTIIYAHNADRLFGKLSGVVPGTVVRIRTTDGVLHSYRVTNRLTVTTAETSWLEPSDEEVLTLYTCTGFMDRYRLVVRAIPFTDSLP